MYYIVEILRSTITKTVGQTESLELARTLALNQSFRSGLTVEIQDEFCRVVDCVLAQGDR